MLRKSNLTLDVGLYLHTYLHMGGLETDGIAAFIISVQLTDFCVNFCHVFNVLNINQLHAKCAKCARTPTEILRCKL